MDTTTEVLVSSKVRTPYTDLIEHCKKVRDLECVCNVHGECEKITVICNKHCVRHIDNFLAGVAKEEIGEELELLQDLYYRCYVDTDKMYDYLLAFFDASVPSMLTRTCMYCLFEYYWEWGIDLDMADKWQWVKWTADIARIGMQERHNGVSMYPLTHPEVNKENSANLMNLYAVYECAHS